jgi:hypothetical protein
LGASRSRGTSSRAGSPRTPFGISCSCRASSVRAR